MTKEERALENAKIITEIQGKVNHIFQEAIDEVWERVKRKSGEHKEGGKEK